MRQYCNPERQVARGVGVDTLESEQGDITFCNNLDMYASQALLAQFCKLQLAMWGRRVREGPDEHASPGKKSKENLQYLLSTLSKLVFLRMLVF